jgi:outer membrane protein OmpA-like peptidoglycan-associated protein
LRVHVLESVDNLIADVNKARLQVVQQVAATEVIPETVDYPECNTALLLYVEIFGKGSANIGNEQRQILSQLAEAMRRCDNYRDLIETHADQRGAHDFNSKLSEHRSRNIAAFLVANGVEMGQFET